MGYKRKCEDSELYPASKCKMKKNKKSDIQQNSVSKKFYLCRICDYQFATIEELSTHLFLEDDSTKKPFSCANEFAIIDYSTEHYSLVCERNKPKKVNKKFTNTYYE